MTINAIVDFSLCQNGKAILVGRHDDIRCKEGGATCLQDFNSSSTCTTNLFVKCTPMSVSVRKIILTVLGSTTTQ